MSFRRSTRLRLLLEKRRFALDQDAVLSCISRPERPSPAPLRQPIRWSNLDLGQRSRDTEATNQRDSSMDARYTRPAKAVAISLYAAPSQRGNAVLSLAVFAALTSAILMLKTVLFLTL